MLSTILIVVLLAIAALLIYAATKPNSFRLQRSTRIKAGPEKIFPLINDFQMWRQWSPWENLDPNLKRDYSGQQTGKGAVYAWEGNKKAGSGRMEIVESDPASRVKIKLDFLKPFEAHNTAEFTLAPGGDETTVNWAMYGPQPYMFKLMGIFFPFEKLVGPDFERGLASMKRAAEA